PEALPLGEKARWPDQQRRFGEPRRGEQAERGVQREGEEINRRAHAASLSVQGGRIEVDDACRRAAGDATEKRALARAAGAGDEACMPRREQDVDGQRCAANRGEPVGIRRSARRWRRIRRAGKRETELRGGDAEPARGSARSRAVSAGANAGEGGARQIGHGASPLVVVEVRVVWGEASPDRQCAFGRRAVRGVRSWEPGGGLSGALATLGAIAAALTMRAWARETIDCRSARAWW